MFKSLPCSGPYSPGSYHIKKVVMCHNSALPFSSIQTPGYFINIELPSSEFFFAARNSFLQFLTQFQYLKWTWPFLDIFLLDEAKQTSSGFLYANKSIIGPGDEFIQTFQSAVYYFKREELFPTREVDFEGRKVYVPK